MEDQNGQLNTLNHIAFRLNIFFIATFIIFGVIIVRLAVLQFIEVKSLQEVENSLASKNVLIPPIRGNIYDSDGKAIAYSTSTQSLYYTIQPDLDNNDSKAIAKQIFNIFNKYGDKENRMSLDAIVKNMDLDFRKNTISVPRRIKSDLTNREIAYFLENKEKFKGIDIVEESIRNYDTSTLAVQLVGYLKRYEGGADRREIYKGRDKNEDLQLRYLGQEGVGYDGLEMMYQDTLRGKNGLKTYPINSEGRIIGPPVLTKPERGNNLFLTINRNVQSKTEQAILDQIEYLQNANDPKIRQPMARTGYAVAMEVKTGKIIAMASMPDYDPNVWADGRISPENYSTIQSIMGNGTISQIYGPYENDKEFRKLPSSLVPLGSTQKPLTVLIGLSEKLITPSSTYFDNGSFYYGQEGTHRRRIGNARGHAYGLLDPAEAIGHSSNPYMAKMVGNALYLRSGDKGVDIWDKYEKKFGLGILTGSELPGESKGIVNYFEERKLASAQSALIQASFGQQGRYTTLQLAQYVATLASHGKRMKPQFVNEIKDSNGNVIQKYTPKVMSTIKLPEAYWKEIEHGMQLVNVPIIASAPYSILRKTGTSQQIVGGRIIDNSVFIAAAPAEDPVLAVAVVMPHAGFGAVGAAPVARKIFDAYNQSIGLFGTPGALSKATPKTAE